MIRGLLVDLGNVLVAFDHGITLRALAGATGHSEEALREGLFSRATPAYDRGELDRERFFRAAEEACGIDRLDDAFWTLAWRDIFTPIEPAGTAGQSGGSGIRTHGEFPHTRFPSVPIRPLSHVSGAGR